MVEKLDFGISSAPCQVLEVCAKSGGMMLPCVLDGSFEIAYQYNFLYTSVQNDPTTMYYLNKACKARGVELSGKTSIKIIKSRRLH